MLSLDGRVVKLMQKVEKVLVRLAVLGILAVVVTQLFVAPATDPMEFYLAFAQKIESAPLEEGQTTWEPNLVLTAEGGDTSKLKLLVNEQVVGTFGKGKFSLTVQPGDRLAVDARSVRQNVRLKVSGIGQDLAYPKLNQIWPIRGSVLDMGQVRSK